MTAVHITVTADDIAAGMPGSNCRCPIALAIRRALPWLTAPGLPVVQLYAVELADGLDAPLAALPDEAATFIEDFDHGGLVVPFAFDLEIDDLLTEVSHA